MIAIASTAFVDDRTRVHVRTRSRFPRKSALLVLARRRANSKAQLKNVPAQSPIQRLRRTDGNIATAAISAPTPDRNEE